MARFENSKTHVIVEVADEKAHRFTGDWKALDGTPSDGEPPRAGKGSGRDAWAAYAAGLGVDVDDDATRDEIIEAVDGK